MDADAQRPNVGHAQSSTLSEREPGFLSGLANLLPRLGYTGVLPSVSFERVPERPTSAVSSSSRSRASSVGFDDDAEAFRTDSTDLLSRPSADQTETSTSGRTGQDIVSAGDSTAAAAAAERHRLGTGSSVDLQVVAQANLQQQELLPTVLPRLAC